VPAPRKRCLACHEDRNIYTSNIRWYWKRMQRSYNIQLCHTCQGAVMDLLEASATTSSSRDFYPPNPELLTEEPPNSRT